MSENPLERLNYYNGMPLSASDFKTEQDYHVRTRRWLNKSLYSAGIARGLEVRPVPGSRVVTVSPGLALDNEGREIIVLEQVPVEVRSYPGTDDSTVVGNYLVVEYAEEAVAHERGGCAVRTKDACASKSTTHWGGPSRIQTQVKFSWVPFVPQPGSNQIVLARVELDSTCSQVSQIDAGPRQDIGARSLATVRQFALEGEREVASIPKDALFPPRSGESDTRVDVFENGKVYFHIRGRRPRSVTLYLRAAAMSPLNYTELGGHSHDINASTTAEDHRINLSDISHKHTIGSVITDVEKGDDSFGGLPPHTHWIQAKLIAGLSGADVLDGKNNFGIQLFKWSSVAQQLDNDVGPVGHSMVYGGDHRHLLKNATDPNSAPISDTPSSFTEIVLQHNNVSSSATAQTAPASALRARNGAPLTFIHDVKVWIGPTGRTTERTDEIRRQLADRDPANWAESAAVARRLGDGTGSHVFATSGTGPIRLDFLSNMTFEEGEYCIELKADFKSDSTGKSIANGGRIHFNLYIE